MRQAFKRFPTCFERGVNYNNRHIRIMKLRLAPRALQRVSHPNTHLCFMSAAEEALACTISVRRVGLYTKPNANPYETIYKLVQNIAN